MKNIEGLSETQSALLRKAAKKDVKLAGAGPHKTARALSAKGYGSVTDGKFQANAAGRAKIAK